ncbi:MAG TPA: nucleotidyltransferase domain-containing protein [Xanthobacteraceae bacterium]|nr:nucleotidyltransferase domain-containing protein [Xanthobacteraceae bacterium]
MRPSEALAKHREQVLEIIARYPVSNPRVFGSVARGEDEEGSDLDILVDHRGLASTFELAGLELELEALLRANVDVRTPGDLSPNVASRVSRDARPL